MANASRSPTAPTINHRRIKNVWPTPRVISNAVSLEAGPSATFGNVVMTNAPPGSGWIERGILEQPPAQRKSFLAFHHSTDDELDEAFCSWPVASPLAV